MCRPRAQFQAADPALPLDTDPDVSALGTMREALIAAVASESAQYRRSAARSSSWTVEKICAACQASDEAIDVALVLVNHALSGVLRRDTFLLDGLFVALEKLDVVIICGRVSRDTPYWCTTASSGRTWRRCRLSLAYTVGPRPPCMAPRPPLRWAGRWSGRSCRWT